MKYSIIIPVYNASKTLNRCVKSILNQSFSDYEIILVNDGSKDNSLKICDDFSKKYENIKSINKPNGGASSARNKGLDNAVGDYIIFVDSDDYVSENYFSEFEKYDATNGLVVFTNSWVSNTKTGKREIKDNFEDSDIYGKTKYLIDSRTINGTMGKIFDRNLIERLNLRFDERMPVAEDFIFCLTYLMNCTNIIIKNISVYIYDESSTDSLLRSRKKGLIDIYPIVFDKAYSTIENSDFSDQQKKELYCIWDKLHVESFGTCVMEEFKDKGNTPKKIQKEIKNMCVKFYPRYKGGYGYKNIIHFVMWFCIKNKLSCILYFLGKLYIKMYHRGN